MAKQTRKTETSIASDSLHRLTVRVQPSIEKRLQAYSVVTDRTYRDLVESAITDYLGRLKLSDDDRRKVRALVGE